MSATALVGSGGNDGKLLIQSDASCTFSFSDHAAGAVNRGQTSYASAMSATVIDMTSSGEGALAYQLWDDRQLTLRMRLRFGGGGPSIDGTIAQVEAALDRVGEGDDMLRVLGVGEFSIGGFGDTGADFTGAWQQVADRGWPMCQHSLRSAESEAHLSAFENVNALTPIADLRWTLDHVNEISDGQLARVEAIGAGVGVQSFAYYGSFGTGPPYRSIIEQGVTAGAGSDGRAISPLNPWAGIYYMVTGRTVNGALVNDGQQVSRLEALRFYTMGTAWIAREETELGSIEVGKLADIVVLDRDFLTVPEDELRDVRATMTFLGGDVVFTAP